MKKNKYLFLLLLLLLSTSMTAQATTNTSLTVSVTNYGAKGTDILDDTSAFQKAIDYAASQGGGTVYVPDGKYILNPIKLKSNVDLIGVNRDTVTLKLSDTANNLGQTRILSINGANNVQVSNITFDGNYEKHYNGTEHMHDVFIYNSDNVVINNNRMQNARGDGVSVSGDVNNITGALLTSDNIKVTNNILLNNHRANIVVEQVNHLEIANNISTSTVGKHTLHFEPWEDIDLYDVKIHDNTFSTNSTGDAMLIQGTFDSSKYFNDIEFYNNTVNAPTSEILIQSTKNLKIHDNTLNVKSVYVWMKNLDTQIYNNIVNATSSAFKVQSTYGLDSKRTTISNNTVTVNGGDAIKIQYGATDTTFIGNTITSKVRGDRAVYMKATELDIVNTQFLNNTFNNFTYGIYTSTYNGKIENGLSVSGNTFKNISSYSVYVKLGTAKNVNVGVNTLISAGGYSVRQ